MMKRMVWVAASATISTALLLAVLFVLVNRPDWWRGLFAATAISALVAAVSSPILAWGLRREVMKAVVAFFLAAAARMILAVGGGLVAVQIGGYPPIPTMLLIVVFYIVLLAAETTAVARVIWSQKV